MKNLNEYSSSLGKRFLKFVSNTIDLKLTNKIKLKDIFNEYWDDFLTYAKNNNLKIRVIILKEVHRVM